MVPSVGIYLHNALLCTKSPSRWILQEVAMSRQSVFCCNKQKLPWCLVVDALLIMRTMKDYFRFDEKASRTLDTVSDLNRKSDDILSLIWKFDQSLCSDPRDRIFSLLGLAMDVEDASLIATYVGGMKIRCSVDYTVATEAVYIQFAESCIQAHRSKTILLHIGAFGALYGRSERFPSWVPDWSKNRDLDHSSMWWSQENEVGNSRFIVSHDKVPGCLTLQVTSRVFEVKRVLKCDELSLTWEELALKIRTFVKSPGFHMASILRVLHLGMQKTRNATESQGRIAPQFSSTELTEFLSALLKDRNLNFRKQQDGLPDQLIRKKLVDDSYRKPWMTESLLGSIAFFLSKFTVLIFKTSDFVGLGPRDSQAGDFVFRHDFPLMDQWKSTTKIAMIIRRTEQLANRDQPGTLRWDQRFRRVMRPKMKNALEDHACRLVGPCLLVSGEYIMDDNRNSENPSHDVGTKCNLTII